MSGLLILLAIATTAPTALVQAHAHNDYLHPRPLLDALDNGFRSVEADVHLVDGKLLVAHERGQCRAERTLQKLYLDPLREHVKAGLRGMTLLIDIKSQAGPTYAALRRVLERYGDLGGAVTFIVTGNQPRGTIAAETQRIVSCDGAQGDLDSDAPVSLMPWISMNWGNNFQWRGEGEMPESEAAYLARLVARVHAHHRRVRFWGAPDNPAAWEELLRAGVDLINTDKLRGLREFLISRHP